ncbi:MAG: uridine phosphorylase [Gammaproteobacteria bacterium]|nr:uridine phosphorylase [Gammaproteobacteria bacterium]
MSENLQYHISLSKSQINGAQYVILPGDPGRVEHLAKAFDKEARHLSSHRGYVAYLANFQGQSVLVCSTGIGGPSASIAMEELANIGLRYFIRVGTCGAIQPHIKLGDLVITRGAVRLDGASTHYAPIEYPAVPSFKLTAALLHAAEQLKTPHHLGITVSSDTFFPGQERYDNHAQYVLRQFQGSLQEWQKLHVSNYEMEASTILTMANVFGLEAAVICGVFAHRLVSERPDPSFFEIARANWENVLVKAVYHHMHTQGTVL